MSAPRLYRIGPTLEALETLERLELSEPPLFAFQNRPQVAEALEKAKPATWTLEDVWRLAPDVAMLAAKVVAKGDDFALDYFLSGLDFISDKLWEILEPFAPTARRLDVDFAGSNPAFIAQNYVLPIFPSLSPFEKMFIDTFQEDADRAHGGTLQMKVRPGFRPAAPIFNVATSPWLMCTEDVVDAVMPHPVRGLEFVNHETDELLVPGR